MTTVNVRIAQRHWEELRAHVSRSFRGSSREELGAIGLIGEVHTPSKRELTVSKVLMPGTGDIRFSSEGALVFDSSYIRRAHLEMRANKLAGIVTFHAHPFSDDRVAFSPYDDSQDPKLVANLRELEPRTQLLSIVLGKGSQSGRLWDESCRYVRANRLVVGGDNLEFLPLTGTPRLPPPDPAATFDRALALTGSGALAKLSEMKIAVVGASGTGCLVAELLVRTGCRKLMLFDDDIVRDVNLNRILYATTADADRRHFKVDVLKRGIENLGLGCDVEAVSGNILDRHILRRLRESDFIFGCVDRAYPRLLLCQHSYRYLIPYVDIGAEVGGDKLGIVSLTSRASYIAPLRHCLQCTGIITPRQLHLESLTWEEQKRVIALGYSEDLVMKRPAVMDLNMRAASLGVMILRHLLQPFLIKIPVTLSENLVTFATLSIDKARAENENCDLCRKNRQYGYGDCADELGLDSEVVRLITEPKISQ
jgi:hypothetical protein